MREKEIKYLAGLVIRVKNQDPDAFVELYNQMYQKIYFLALSIVKDEYLAQDVVQETFINVYESIRFLENDRMFVAWINRIAYHCSLQILGKNGEIPLDGEMMEHEMGTEDGERNEPLENVLTRENSETLMKLIMGLPPEYKTTLILRYYEDLRLDEIAECLECSVGTVKSRLNRGKSVLRRRMMEGGRFLAILAVGAFTLPFSMKAYAAEHAMALAVSGELMTAVSKEAGISSASKAVMSPKHKITLTARKKLLTGGAALLLAGGGIWVSDTPEISVKFPGDAYTREAVPVTIRISSIVPVKSVSLIGGGEGTKLRQLDQEDLYESEISDNGWYWVEAELLNGKKVSKQFEIATIDVTAPRLYWYSWDNDHSILNCLVSDDRSGVDYTNVYKEDLEGTKYLPLEWKEETGEIKFELSEVPFYIHLSDKNGNSAVYWIESYLDE